MIKCNDFILFTAPCPAKVEYVTPVFAKNFQGSWRYVVQIPYEGYFTQTVEVTRCLQTKCHYLGNFHFQLFVRFFFSTLFLHRRRLPQLTTMGQHAGRWDLLSQLKLWRILSIEHTATTPRFPEISRISSKTSWSGGKWFVVVLWSEKSTQETETSSVWRLRWHWLLPN